MSGDVHDASFLRHTHARTRTLNIEGCIGTKKNYVRVKINTHGVHGNSASQQHLSPIAKHLQTLGPSKVHNHS